MVLVFAMYLMQAGTRGRWCRVGIQVKIPVKCACQPSWRRVIRAGLLCLKGPYFKVTQTCVPNSSRNLLWGHGLPGTSLGMQDGIGLWLHTLKEHHSHESYDICTTLGNELFLPRYHLCTFWLGLRYIDHRFWLIEIWCINHINGKPFNSVMVIPFSEGSGTSSPIPPIGLLPSGFLAIITTATMAYYHLGSWPHHQYHQ